MIGDDDDTGEVEVGKADDVDDVDEGSWEAGKADDVVEDFIDRFDGGKADDVTTPGHAPHAGQSPAVDGPDVVIDSRFLALTPELLALMRIGADALAYLEARLAGWFSLEPGQGADGTSSDLLHRLFQVAAGDTLVLDRGDGDSAVIDGHLVRGHIRGPGGAAKSRFVADLNTAMLTVVL
jgi:hypothetical protein